MLFDPEARVVGKRGLASDVGANQVAMHAHDERDSAAGFG